MQLLLPAWDTCFWCQSPHIKDGTFLSLWAFYVWLITIRHQMFPWSISRQMLDHAFSVPVLMLTMDCWNRWLDFSDLKTWTTEHRFRIKRFTHWSGYQRCLGVMCVSKLIWPSHCNECHTRELWRNAIFGVQHTVLRLNSSRPSDTYMRQWIIARLVEIMACT